MKSSNIITLLLVFLVLAEGIYAMGYPIWKDELDNVNIFKKEFPAQGKLVVGIGDSPLDVIEKSSIKGVDLKQRFSEFMGSPDFPETVRFVYDDPQFGFEISSAILIGISSFDEEGRRSKGTPLTALKVRSISILKAPIYLDYDSVIKEVGSWEDYFEKLGFYRVKGKNDLSIEEAEAKFATEIKGNRFPTFYLSSWVKNDITYKIGVGRAENQAKSSEYVYNVDLYITNMARKVDGT